MRMRFLRYGCVFALAALAVWVGCVEKETPVQAYQLTVDVSPEGGGRVEFSPNPGHDRTDYDSGTAVVVTAEANKGYRFVGWSGASLSLQSYVAVTMSGDIALTAKFQEVFTDERDDQEYRFDKIGGVAWMTENLNYSAGTDSSWCYGGDDSYCALYGRLYNWDAAMAACPSGWRLPGGAEWDSLMVEVGGVSEVELVIETDGYGGVRVVDSLRYYGYVGTALKSKGGWVESGAGDYNIAGTDDYWFSAMPGGYHDIDGSFTLHTDLRAWFSEASRNVSGRFSLAGESGFWWSAAEAADGGSAYFWYMYRHNENVFQAKQDKRYGFSVRCVRGD